MSESMSFQRDDEADLTKRYNKLHTEMGVVMGERDQLQAQLAEVTKRLGQLSMDRSVVAAEVRKSFQLQLSGAHEQIAKLERIQRNEQHERNAILEQLARANTLLASRQARGKWPRGWWLAHMGTMSASFKTYREALHWIDMRDRRCESNRSARYVNAIVVQVGSARYYHGVGHYTRRNRKRVWCRQWRRVL